MVYYIVSGLFLMLFWFPCMAINVNVQYNDGFLPDIILLTQFYLHRGTCLTGPLFPIGIEHLIYMKFFCYGSSYGY